MRFGTRLLVHDMGQISYQYFKFPKGGLRPYNVVQVIWRLDNGARTYLPRMAGALTAINPVPSDAACYILTQADNTIRMVHSPSQHVLHVLLLPGLAYSMQQLCLGNWHGSTATFDGV